MATKWTFVIIALWLLVNCSSQDWAVEDDGCRTPDRGVGKCILIKECAPLASTFSSSKPLTQEQKNQLKEFFCGFAGRNVKVCCPSSVNLLLPVVQPNPLSNLGGDGPPDVSQHRNLGLLPSSTCGLTSTIYRIINGEKTGIFEFPWMALISYRTARGAEFRCGGSIINSRYILTAAHCIKNVKNPIIGVRVGEHDISKSQDCEALDKTRRICAPPVQDMAIESIIPHPSYNPNGFKSDIGLIRLARNINLTVDNVAPICLPLDDQRNANLDNKKLTVTGWGVTETGYSSNTLLKVHIPVMSYDNCRKTYETVSKIDHKQICAGGRDQKDSCGGDSGGPLQTSSALFGEPRYIQHGIVSFGPKKCGFEGLPGVYTKISYYMDWILDNLKP